MEYLSNDHKDCLNQHKNSHNLWDETGYPVVNLDGNWGNSMIRNPQWRESHGRTNTSVRRNKSKREGLWESQSGIRVGTLTIWVRSFEIIIAFKVISSNRIGKPVLMMDVKVSKDKNIGRWVDWVNLVNVRWNRIKNHAQRWRRWL